VRHRFWSRAIGLQFEPWSQPTRIWIVLKHPELTYCNDSSPLFMTLITVNELEDSLIQIIPQRLDRIVLRMILCVCRNIVSKFYCRLLSYFGMPAPKIAEQAVQNIGR
jgi:hypothetical protein